MIYVYLADFVLLLHLAFILFAIFGGLLVFRIPRTIWIHIPTLLWAAAIEFTGWICPLTPLENNLRIAAGKLGYQGGFISHYILPIIYPTGLSRESMFFAGLILILWNILIYGWYFSRQYKYRNK